MWVEILCGLVGLVIYKLFRRFFDGDDGGGGDLQGIDLSFAVANRLENVYGGKVYVGLRIPDPETSSRQHIDAVLVTKGEVMVVAVRGFSGFVESSKDGSWICTRDKKHKPETFPDPVLEIRRHVAILESYLEQRGVPLPEGYLTGKVILPNPNCRTGYSIASQSEVISFDKWLELKPEPKSVISNWIKDTFHGGKSEIQTGLYSKLDFILSTAPMWDRLELKGDKNILGEFIEFKGSPDDMQALRNLKRSKVQQLIMQKSTLFGVLGRSRVHILVCPRDYRGEGVSANELKDITVRHGTEVMFQPLSSKKPRKFRLSSICSMSLNA